VASPGRSVPTFLHATLASAFVRWSRLRFPGDAAGEFHLVAGEFRATIEILRASRSILVDHPE